MAVFRFSALSDGQSLVFNPTADVLNFDQTTVAAADLRVTQVGSNIRIDVVSGPQTGKDVTLQNVSPLQLSVSNTTFADGSRLLFGDLTSGTANDNAANTINGTAGRDLLQGFGGADTMNGGAGNDTYIVSTGDVLSDTGGTDTVLSDVSWTLADGFENLTATGTAGIALTGNNAANVLTGNSGNNFFNPRGGDDTIQGGAGNDQVTLGGGGVPSYGNKVIDLGAGIDRLDFSGFAKSAIVVDLAAGTLVGGGTGGAGSAQLISIETVVGDAFDDRISGSAAAESLNGGGGNDTLDGRGGNDTLTGGAGADTFVNGGAQVTDFVSGTDKLSFDNAIFTELGAPGNFAAGDARFAAGPGFFSGQDASDRLIYDTASGQLFYDSDGSGAGPSRLIGTLQGAPALLATDITVTGQQPDPSQGTDANDSLVGTEGDDSINGRGGDDTIDGRGGNDTLNGGSGIDLVLGGAGDDTLIDTDLVAAGAAPDTLDGGLGNDTYDLRSDNFFPFPPTVLRDAGGVDTVLSEGFTLPEGFENLVLFARDSDVPVRGTGNSSNNVISVSGSREGRDTIDGADGDDTLIGGFGGEVFTFVAGSGNYGHDSVDGGPTAGTLDPEDFDVLSFEGARSAVVVDMRTGIATGGGVAGSGSVTFTSIEEVRGGSFDDRLTAYDGVRDSSGNLIGAHLVGGAGNDTLIGGLSDDAISGDEGNDEIHAGAGDDLISLASRLGFVTYGNDTIDGGAGFDTLEVGSFAKSAVVVDLAAGTVGGGGDGGSGSASVGGIEGVRATPDNAFNNRFSGSSAAESLVGGNGNDTLSGLGGNDTLEGGGGQDTFLFASAPGAANADFVLFLSGSDKLAFDGTVFTAIGPSGNFTAGDARFFAAAGATSGHDADDRIVFNTSTGELFYDADGNGAGAAQLVATLQPLQMGLVLAATDIVVDNGAAPNPTTTGTAGDDSLTGTAGDDLLQGLAGNDTLNGLAGNDTLDAGTGADSLVGGTGNDTYIVDGPGDTVVENAGEGTDTVLSSASLTLADGFENLTLTGTGNINATGNNATNILVGNSGNNFFNPRGGDDTIQGGAGNDQVTLGGGGVASYGNKVIDLGAGFDRLDFSGFAKSAIVVDLAAGTLVGGGTGGAGSARLTGIEQVVGDGFNDRLSGSSVAESLNGGGGNDTLDGRGGNDTLTGGLGADTFAFSATPAAGNADQVTDFVSASDKLSFDNAVFTALGADGNFVAGDARFAAGAGFTSGRDASDRIVYDTTTGNLYYDADGSGTGASQLIATLQGHPTLAATDIVVVWQPQSLQGTAGNDALTGTERNDSIAGLAGNDGIIGLGGDDTLDGGAGNDYLQADDGNDTVIGGAGDDAIEGGPGDDSLVGGDGNDIFDLEFSGVGAGADTMEGGAGNDVYLVTQGDVVNDALGDDGYVLEGGLTPADFVIDDAGGTDSISVYAGDSWTLAPGFENLSVYINQGDDNGVPGTLEVGNALNNVIDVSAADGAILDGREGNDTLIGSGPSDGFLFTVAPGSANADVVVGFRSDVDTLELDNAVYANLGATGSLAAGDERFFAGAGATSGHDANDRVVYNTTSGELFYDADGSGAGNAQLIATLKGAPALAPTDIAVIAHGSSNVFGSQFNDELFGTGGSDFIDGRGGDDVIRSGQGNDTLVGGPGGDLFRFDTGPEPGKVDLVEDFVSGADKAVFGSWAFTAIGQGDFVTGDARFAAGAGFTSGRDASDRMVYDTNTGNLYYDADGSGAGGAQLVATLEGHPAVTATDIWVL